MKSIDNTAITAITEKVRERHFKKNYKIKQIIYVMISFYFKLSGIFPIFKNDCLQHVNISTKNILDNYKSTKV